MSVEPALIEQLQHLHTDRNRKTWTAATGYRAPHKILLLLAVIDLVEQGEIRTSFVECTPDLIDQFARYWRAIDPPSLRGQIEKPFFHMRSEPFWELVPKPGKESILQTMSTANSKRQLDNVILGAKIDRTFFNACVDPKERDILRSTLISHYFDSPTGDILARTIRLNNQAFNYSKWLLESTAGEQDQVREVVGELPEEVPETVRDQGFRTAVTRAYEHRCVICGVRMRTLDGHTAVDAAHIVPWSESHCDKVSNGLALCKLCHWTFDEYLISISESQRILVSPVLRNMGNMLAHLLSFENREMFPPCEPSYLPRDEYLAHHRKRFQVTQR